WTSRSAARSSDPDCLDIRLLFVRTRFRSTLPSDGPSRFRPCASLVLHLHQVAQGTFTPRLLDVPSTQGARRRLRRWPLATLDLRCACRRSWPRSGRKNRRAIEPKNLADIVTPRLAVSRAVGR